MRVNLHPEQSVIKGGENLGEIFILLYYHIIGRVIMPGIF